MANNFFKRWSDNKLTKQSESCESQSAPECTPDTEASRLDGTAPDSVDHREDQEHLAQGATEQDVIEPSITEQGVTKLDSDATTLQGEATKLEGAESLSVADMLTEGIKGSIKKQALRKLFLSGEFSEVDRLNDYDHDYKSVKSLSTDAASQLRNWLKDTNRDETDAEENEIIAEPSTLKEGEAEQSDKAINTEEPDEGSLPQKEHDDGLNSEIITGNNEINNENYSVLAGAGDK